MKSAVRGTEGPTAIISSTAERAFTYRWRHHGSWREQISRGQPRKLLQKHNAKGFSFPFIRFVLNMNRFFGIAITCVHASIWSHYYITRDKRKTEIVGKNSTNNSKPSLRDLQNDFGLHIVDSSTSAL